MATQVVTLLVTPEQAEKLSLAANQTTIQLVLRNPLDRQTARRRAPRWHTFSTRGLAKPPEAPPAPRPRTQAAPPVVREIETPAKKEAPFTMEIIMGTQKSTPSSKLPERRNRCPDTGSSHAYSRRRRCCARPGARPRRRTMRRPGSRTRPAQSTPVEKWTVTVGKSLVMDSPLPIERLSVADGNLADAVAIGPKEVLINGKTPGETSLIVWQKGGSRLIYDLVVRMSPARLEAVRQQLARDYPDDDINVTFDNDAVFVRGTVKDVVAAERVMAIASTLGKPVNLLRVDVPPSEAQILVKVRFANVDRSASRDLAVEPGQRGVQPVHRGGRGSRRSAPMAPRRFTLADAVNIFLFRKDLNLVATLQALESKSQLEMLAEPTVPAINGKQAVLHGGRRVPVSR